MWEEGLSFIQQTSVSGAVLELGTRGVGGRPGLKQLGSFHSLGSGRPGGSLVQLNPPQTGMGRGSVRLRRIIEPPGRSGLYPEDTGSELGGAA